MSALCIGLAVILAVTSLSIARSGAIQADQAEAFSEFWVTSPPTTPGQIELGIRSHESEPVEYTVKVDAGGRPVTTIDKHHPRPGGGMDGYGDDPHADPDFAGPCGPDPGRRYDAVSRAHAQRIGVALIGRVSLDRLFGSVRGGQARQIVKNSVSLVGSVAMTSGVGFVYWLVAALLFPQAQIGIAASGISAMMLLASLATFGVGTLLLAEIPRHGGREPGLIATAMLFSGVVGLVLGIAFAVTVAAANEQFKPLAESPFIVVVFGIGVGLTAGAAVLDVALLALLRSDLQFARNAIFALVKLGLLVAVSATLVGSEAHASIIETWIFGLLVSVIALAGYALRRGVLGRIRPLQFEALRRLRGDAFRHHLLNLSLAVPDWTMPILVTVVLTAAASGAFFIAWMMAGVAMFVPASLAQSLNAVVARAPQSLPANLRLTLRLSFIAGVLIIIPTVLIGPFVLSLLGQRYFEAAPALIILSLGIFPVAIKAHYVTIGRLEDSLVGTTAVTAAGAAIELLLAAIGGVIGGITGVALGVLLGLVIQAIAMSPRIRRVLRDIGSAGPAAIPGATD